MTPIQEGSIYLAGIDPVDLRLHTPTITISTGRNGHQILTTTMESEALAQADRQFQDMLMWGREYYRVSTEANGLSEQVINPRSQGLWQQLNSGYTHYYNPDNFHFDIDEWGYMTKREKTQREIEDELDAKGEIIIEF